VGPRGEHDDVRGFVARLDLTAASERPSPTLNALPMMALQRYIGTPRLAWDFLTLHEPEPWDEYFALVDQPRARLRWRRGAGRSSPGGLADGVGASAAPASA
jgi:hypothetical protein